ncbi:type III secretion system chaperone [Castellaniella defragrans]|uniref:type III secretion system chaperone n=1 Tax=Castellaniella defragrans TaxID=75697 RepID=UPI0023F21E53|nr:type III secretion system chaperone [Castellaniella defragrans]
MSLSSYQALIAELGGTLGMADMAAGEDGYVGLVIDDHEIHLQHEADDDAVILFARLPEADPDRRDAVYAMLLAANVFWQGTRGATFSADFDTGRVFLADRRALAALDAESLSVWIEQFANVAAHWRRRIEDANDGGPLRTPEAAGAAPAGPFGLPGMPPGGSLA